MSRQLTGALVPQEVALPHALAGLQPAHAAQLLMTHLAWDDMTALIFLIRVMLHIGFTFRLANGQWFNLEVLKSYLNNTSEFFQFQFFYFK